MICGAPGYRGLQKGFPQTLTGKPFLLPMAHSKLRTDLEHYFEIAGVRPVIVGESQESEIDRRLALSGHALIATSRHGIEAEIASKRLAVIGTIETVREQIWLTGVRRHVVNPVAAKLMATFKVL